jgi:hypothetical protein
MRRVVLCRHVQTDAGGRFGPIWVRFTYLLGDIGQQFEVHAYGGPHDQAAVTLPPVRVVT